jgi:hypothetical protein
VFCYTSTLVLKLDGDRMCVRTSEGCDVDAAAVQDVTIVFSCFGNLLLILLFSCRLVSIGS